MSPADTAMLVLVIGALVIGLLSMLIGHIAALYDWLRAWWRAGVAKALDEIMSSEIAPEPTTSDDVPDTHQESENADSQVELQHDIIHMAISRRMPRNEQIVLLAVQLRDDDSFLYSRNQIASFVGGTRGDVLRLIGEARGDIPQPKPVFPDLNSSNRPVALDFCEGEHVKQ